MCKKAILDKIKEYSSVIIHRHVRPDPDAYGSQAGLAELISSNFPEIRVWITGEDESSLHFLTRMNKVADDTYQDALVIVCDTANQARIDDQRYKNGKELIKIDHHPVVDAYGDLQWVDTSASSTCEMIYELYLEMAKEGFRLNEKAARLIYAGIVGDTGRFLFPSTTPKTLTYASELVQFPFSREELYNEMYKTPLHVARLKGYILQNLRVKESGHAVVNLSKEVLDQHHVTPAETSRLVGLLGDIEGILSWVFFVEEEGNIRVRLRSKGPVINTIAERHNGGGHPLASGASAATWEETEAIASELEAACLDYKAQL